MEYKIVILTDANIESEYVLATVPYDIMSRNTGLGRASRIMEYLAKEMWGTDAELREMKGQLYPMYYADKQTGQTISIK